MIIKDVHIKKFRGFNDVQFQLGENLTVIAGQNGTQKTTLLGIISQPFTITDKNNPLFGERPLCGGNYKSLFSEKFKLSDAFDIAQSHEWTLKLHNNAEPEFTVESINRDSENKAGIRFWKKGNKSKGSGYIQLPVIYLSLSRLFPIGEDDSLGTSNEINLTPDEYDFYQKFHNKILIIPDVEMTSVDYLSSVQKNTLGANTAFYDWRMNSAGQDNIGKILLAILSFKRLQDSHGQAYQGGILAIDELDATLYPASQLKLLEVLRKFSSQLRIQIVFTTHSLNILEQTCEWQSNAKIAGQVKVVYLQKMDEQVEAVQNITFQEIKDNLNVALSGPVIKTKIPVFTEDNEGKIFVKALLKRKAAILDFVDGTLGCDVLIDLAERKITGFRSSDSIIALDGDVREQTRKKSKVAKMTNILVLPGLKSPERMFAHFLYNLPSKSPVWLRISRGYSKQIVFRDVSLKEIDTSREKAKEWFNLQRTYWGRNCTKMINQWMSQNKEEVEDFIAAFDVIISKFDKILLNP